LLSTVSQRPHLDITEAASPETPDEEEQNNIGVYKRALPSVVNITSRAMAFDFFYGAVPQEGQGSGFVIDKEGRILTNFHVIADAQEVWATLSNKKKYRATVIAPIGPTTWPSSKSKHRNCNPPSSATRTAYRSDKPYMPSAIPSASAEL